MTFSVESYSPPSSEFASNLLFNIDALLDAYFAKKKILHEIRCCSSYFFCQTKISISLLCGKYFLNMEINFVNLE